MSQTPQQARKNPDGTPFKDMSQKQKVLFVLKLAVCILSFGMIFPNVMGE